MTWQLFIHSLAFTASGSAGRLTTSTEHTGEMKQLKHQSEVQDCFCVTQTLPIASIKQSVYFLWLLLVSSKPKDLLKNRHVKQEF